jgi:hypothetical protein
MLFEGFSGYWMELLLAEGASCSNIREAAQVLYGGKLSWVIQFQS